MSAAKSRGSKGKPAQGRTGRPPKVPGGLERHNLRLPPALVRALDAEVRRLKRDGYTRSDLIRDVLQAHVDASKNRQPRPLDLRADGIYGSRRLK